MHYRRAFTLYFSKRRETDVLWSYNYIYVIYYTLQVTTIQVHLTVCLWQQHQASFFQNCWAVVENCTRTSSTDWRYYYWVQKSKTKQIKMVVKLWLKSCHVFIKSFYFQCYYVWPFIFRSFTSLFKILIKELHVPALFPTTYFDQISPNLWPK